VVLQHVTGHIVPLLTEKFTRDKTLTCHCSSPSSMLH